MSDEKDPQDQQTAWGAPPKEPGEIGWPADAAEPGDPSVPDAGSGAPHGAYDPGPGTPPTLADAPAEEPAVEPDPEIVAEPVAELDPAFEEPEVVEQTEQPTE